MTRQAGPLFMGRVGTSSNMHVHISTAAHYCSSTVAGERSRLQTCVTGEEGWVAVVRDGLQRAHSVRPGLSLTRACGTERAEARDGQSPAGVGRRWIGRVGIYCDTNPAVRRPSCVAPRCVRASGSPERPSRFGWLEMYSGQCSPHPLSLSQNTYALQPGVPRQNASHSLAFATKYFLAEPS